MRDNPEKVEFTPAEMKGLPESYIANLKKMKRAIICWALIIRNTSRLWSWQKVMKHANATRPLTRVANEQNLQFMKKAIDLRYEMAQLLIKKAMHIQPLNFVWQNP